MMVFMVDVYEGILVKKSTLCGVHREDNLRVPPLVSYSSAIEGIKHGKMPSKS